MNNKEDNMVKGTVVTMLFIVLFVLIGLTVVYSNHKTDASKKEYRTRVSLYKRVNGNYELRKTSNEALRNKVASKVTKQKPKTSKQSREITTNQNQNDNLSAPVKKFFKIYYTFNNHNSYVARPSKLKNVATSNVLNNKNLFDNDKGADHKSNINELGITCNFDSALTYPVSKQGSLTTVVADVEFDGKKSSSAPATSEKWFSVNINNKNHKIVSVTPIYKQNNVDADSND